MSATKKSAPLFDACAGADGDTLGQVGGSRSRTYLSVYAKDNPAAAGDVIQTIYDGCSALSAFPERGRSSRMLGRRELVFSSLPYIAVYRLRLDVVEIIRIYQSAQNWP